MVSLWLRSRYIPRGLAILGILASLAMALVNLAAMLFPGFAATVSIVYYAPMFVFEVTLGAWLLAAGLREPAGVASRIT